MKDALGITFILLILSWMMFFYQGSVDYNIRRQAVGNIVYRYTQTAGKKGVLNDVIYEELEDKLSIYGDYKIKVLAEKFNNKDLHLLANEDVVDYDLRENMVDILTIYVESKEEHWLDKVLQISPFGRIDTSNINYNIIAKSSVYVQ